MANFNAQIQQMSEQTVGKLLVGGGTSLTTLQIVTEYASLALIFINITAVLIGLYFLIKRHSHEKRRNRRQDDG